MIAPHLVRVSVSLGSIFTVGFGIWHFFVPQAWKWSSYIDCNATELVVAMRAINAFFPCPWYCLAL